LQAKICTKINFRRSYLPRTPLGELVAGVRCILPKNPTPPRPFGPRYLMPSPLSHILATSVATAAVFVVFTFIGIVPTSRRCRITATSPICHPTAPIVPRHQLSSYGRRAFCVPGPSVWNSLPDSLRNAIIGGNSFRQSLKSCCSQRTGAFSALEVSRRCTI